MKMHAGHGSTASIPADSTSSAGNGKSTSRKHHRHSSHTNSSASVITVKRPGSLSSSGAGARNSAVPMKAQSPIETSLIALRLSREALSQEHMRRKSVAVDTTERASSEGLGNLHRWSHSTTSSVTSVNNPSSRTGHTSSGAVLPPFTTQPYSPPKRSWTPVDHSPRASPQRKTITSRPSSRRRQSPTSSPERERQARHRPGATNSLTALPPLHTTPALTDPNDTESPSTIQTIATPTTQASYGHDYFCVDSVSPRSNTKTKKPVLIRHHVASMSNGGSSRHPIQDVSPEALPENGSADYREDETTMAGLRNRDSTQQTEKTKWQPAEEKNRHKRSRTREKGERDKKQMLSRALQKANTAVLLDNAQNFEGALEAYGEACRLLQQVMERSSGADDKRKLDAIRVTYTNRIEELRQLESAQPEPSDAKSLPARPMSDESLPLSPQWAMSPTIDASMQSSPVVETAMETQIIDVPRLSYPGKDRESFFSGTIRAVEASRKGFADRRRSVESSAAPEQDISAQSHVESLRFDASAEPDVRPNDHETEDQNRAIAVRSLKPLSIRLPLPEESKYIPAPLSPRRPLSPKLPTQDERASEQQPEMPQSEPSPSQENEEAPMSWLDTIDESNSSCASSVHSRSSQQGLRRKHIRGASGDTNADFDAAFDAAVEAAYNEGLEPDLEGLHDREIGLKEKHAKPESISAPSADAQELLSSSNRYQPSNAFPLAPEDEEEERLLDYITQDYAQGFNFDLSSKSALPRQSDSSGYSRSTWQSSQTSERATAGTSLSTVAEDTLPKQMSQNAFAAASSINTSIADPPPPPPAPPPQMSLPKLPNSSQNRLSSVRSRRLSGQNPKQLKIQTSTADSEARKRASTFHHGSSPFKKDEEHKVALDKDFNFGARLEPTASEKQNAHLLRSPPSSDLRSAVSDSSRPMTATTVTTDQRTSLDEDPSELTIHRPAVFRKNQSSVSLREHTVLLASPTVETGPSVITPMSSSFMNFAAKRNNETPLTTQRATLPSFGSTAMDSLYSGGVYLFDTSLSSSHTPTSPRSPISAQPSGLEPCPESSLLRPFWILRTILSTLTHPKGGFLTTRLFVPREVWQTKGVKLKNVEDKISNCDLLTAALGRLANVDTYDADATMDELQNFEEVMERVQMALVKKLGSDVGVSGLSGMFKEATSGPSLSTTNTFGPDTTSGAEKTKSKEGKGYLNSWRKLRSKSSGAPIGGSQIHKVYGRTAERDLPTMDSVPMTNYVPVERRGHKKDVRNLSFEGPNREYMGSIARLLEGVQVLDQIARQVVDPGLKGTSTTHVGLELSIRHAAEFFCFYVCRFVLADLGILLDKFVKRGTEWVLA